MNGQVPVVLRIEIYKACRVNVNEHRHIVRVR